MRASPIFYIGVNTGAPRPAPDRLGLDCRWLPPGLRGLAAIGMARRPDPVNALTRKNLPASLHHVGTPSPAPRSATSPWHWSVSWSLSVSWLATGLMTADNLKNWVMGFIFIGAIACSHRC